jgi:hypothetical protein
MSIPQEDRRRHERVNDDIVLYWQEVNSEDINESYFLQGESPSFFSLPTQIKLKLLNQETSTLLQQIGHEHPLLLEYFKILEHKIDILAREVTKQTSPTGKLPSRYVNLSAAGLAFVTDTEYTNGVLLELKMVLPPNLVGIVAYGRVVDSIPNDDHAPNSFSTGVDFIRLRDADRELLRRHVARRQKLVMKQSAAS